MAEITLNDIDHDLGLDGNMAGIVPRLVYGYVSDVATWPEEPEPPVAGDFTMELAGKLVGDIVMKPGKRAFGLDFTEDVGSVKIAPVGEIDGEHWEYTLSIIKAKIQAKILGFANASQARKMFFIAQDENGMAYLLGNKRRAPKLATGGDGATTGTTSGDRNQISMEWKYRAGKALVYDGLIEELLTPAPAAS